jgi:hypothetical protein
MKIAYTKKAFRSDSLAIIEQSLSICTEYARQGYDMTLRQLYYQIVANDLFPDERRWTWLPDKQKWVRDDNGTKNAEPNYKWLGDVINDARLAGLIDWDHISDRTRNLSSLLHFDDPADRIQHAARAYRIDKWADQPYRVEVWVEKEALAGIVGQVAQEWDCPYFSCRGYVSQSEMHAAGRRLAAYLCDEQHPVIIHLGDHDPSGIDMTRDVEDRLRLFMTDGLYDTVGAFDGDPETLRWVADNEIDLTVDRIALNMNQIRQYNPPPNPAKLTDSRCAGYIQNFGNQSWELDALSPAQMATLISEAVQRYLEADKWNAQVEREREEREALIATAQRWSDVEEFIREGNA